MWMGTTRVQAGWCHLVNILVVAFGRLARVVQGQVCVSYAWMSRDLAGTSYTKKAPPTQGVFSTRTGDPCNLMATCCTSQRRYSLEHATPLCSSAKKTANARTPGAMNAFLTSLGFRLPSEASLRPTNVELALVEFALQGVSIKDEPGRVGGRGKQRREKQHRE